MTNENGIQEKRGTERVKTTLNRAFNCDIKLPNESVMNCFVHIENISATGMQIHIDFPLPDNATMQITLYAKETITLSMKKIWQKQLLGGTLIMGFEFMGDNTENTKKILEFTNQFSPEGKRKAYRLNKVLAVELSIEKELKKFYTLTQDLSSRGMRIMNDEDIPAGAVVNIKMLLDVNEPHIELNCRIIWSKPTSFGYFLLGMEFIDISAETANIIETFIDKCFLEDEKEKESEKNQKSSLEIQNLG